MSGNSERDKNEQKDSFLGKQKSHFIWQLVKQVGK